ncbi:B-cell CLL/lymphoma 6 member B protein isoform X1 [Lepisosteus oculatus]|uniref:B-cell CLL/lymphoma 6 member B protein isoform X1 n=2 Tax=Lepisosteus oculatus TaxID=7918 RepID=UPI0037120793
MTFFFPVRAQTVRPPAHEAGFSRATRSCKSAGAQYLSCAHCTPLPFLLGSLPGCSRTPAPKASLPQFPSDRPLKGTQFLSGRPLANLFPGPIGLHLPCDALSISLQADMSVNAVLCDERIQREGTLQSDLSPSACLHSASKVRFPGAGLARRTPPAACPLQCQPKRSTEMSSRSAVEGYAAEEQCSGSAGAEGYVKEFTRHSNDVLLNLNELRHRQILTDATLVVGTMKLRAHCAVLIACSGFFYSLFSRRGSAELSVLTLPATLDVGAVSLLLDFMYTSRLPLSRHTVGAVLTAATYLQMEHVADTCRAFILASENMAMHPRSPGLDSSGALQVPAGGAHPCSASGRGMGLAAQANGVPAPSSAQHTLSSQPQEGAPLGQHKDIPRGLCDSWAPRGPGSCLNSEPRPEGVKMEAESSGSPSPAPDSPARSSCHPNSPSEASGCGSQTPHPPLAAQSDSRPNPDPKACNWKKYKFIVLNPLCTRTAVKEEEPEEEAGVKEGAEPYSHTPTSPDRTTSSDSPAQEAGKMEEGVQPDRLAACPRCQVCQQSFQSLAHLCRHMLGSHPGEDLPVPPPLLPEGTQVGGANSCSLCHRPCPLEQASPGHPLRYHGDDRQENKCCCSGFRYRGNLGGAKSIHTGEKPYRCSVCGAQFNRPANLKTHSRIHSGEKPYRCDTCGARFVQVAHLRAHVLIHTGEKPYPCETCGTRFRHLQTLKSHIRIHTGEKPYTCEKCDLHFRHKSQLRLHLRQKHGAVTNTKIRYKVLSDPYRTILETC